MFSRSAFGRWKLDIQQDDSHMSAALQSMGFTLWATSKRSSTENPLTSGSYVAGKRLRHSMKPAHASRPAVLYRPPAEASQSSVSMYFMQTAEITLHGAAALLLFMSRASE